MSACWVIKDSGKRQDFGTGSVRDIQEGKGRFDLLPVDALELLAILYEKGCLKYGERNWEKGQPLSRYLNSAMRHGFKHLRGDTDERHDISAIWNLMCMVQTKIWIDQGKLPAHLDDLPK